MCDFARPILPMRGCPQTAAFGYQTQAEEDREAIVPLWTGSWRSVQTTSALSTRAAITTMPLTVSDYTREHLSAALIYGHIWP